MAYRKDDSQRILSGSLNLLPPADKVGSPDSPILHNFRVDQAGQLRVRRGTFADTTTLGAAVTGLHRVGNDRFGGVGSALHMGTALATFITNGFDGNAIRFAAYQEQLWVMNRGKQGKAGAGGGGYFRPWVPSAPGSAPTVVAGAQTTAAVVGFDTAETKGADPFPATVNDQWTTWRIDASGNTDADSSSAFDTSNKATAGTSSIAVDCNPPARYQLRRTFSVAKDLRLTAERDDDQFRIWFYAEDVSRIDSIFVILYSGTTEPKGVATVEIPVSLLQSTSYAWNELIISRRAYPASAVDADPQYREILRQLAIARDVGDQVAIETLTAQAQTFSAAAIARPYFKTANDFNWGAVKEIVCEVTVNEACFVLWDDATMVGGSSASIEGEYQWGYTVEDADGVESNLSPISAALVLDKQPATITFVAPPTGKKYIYRIGGPLNTFHRVGSVLSGVGSFSDTTSNDAAITLGVHPPEDHDEPPAARGVVGPFLGRLLGWSTAAHPSRLFWTPVARPWAWPGASDEAEGNWIDVGQDDDELLTVTLRSRSAWLYKNRSIHRLNGDPDVVDPEEVIPTVGAAGEDAVAPWGDVDFFVGSDGGVHRFNGDSTSHVSQKIDPIFRGETVEVGGVQCPPLNRAAISKCVLAASERKLWFAYPSNSGTVADTLLVLDLETNFWATAKVLRSAGVAAQWTKFHDEGAGVGLVGGTAQGDVVQLETGYARDYSTGGSSGNAISVMWQSPFLDQGLPQIEKTYQDLTFDFQTATGAETPSALTVKAVVFDGSTETEYALASLVNAGRRQQTIRITTDGQGRKGYRIAIRLEGDVTSTVVIYGVWINFYTQERSGQSFDTGVVDLGTGLPKLVDRIELDITATGTGQKLDWYLYSDIGGDVMTLRESGTGASGLAIPAAAGARGTVTLKLAAEQTGRRFRVLFTDDANFTVHAIRLRLKVTGVYLLSGDEWISDPIGAN